MKIRTMLVGFDEERREEISARLYNTEAEIVKAVNDYSRLPDEVDRTRPDVLLISKDTDRKLMAVSKQIYIIYPHCIQIMIADEPEEELYFFAMEAGMKKIIAPLPEEKEFISILKELYLNENSREINLIENARDIIRTEYITVMGAKGGIGKTTLAVNIAVQLASAKKKVVLLDLNLQFGDVALFLGLDTRNTITELLEEQRTPTIDVVEEYLTVHQSGLKILASPKSPEYAENISAKRVEMILKVLQNYYDYVIIDAPLGFSDVSLSVLDMADDIFFLTNTEICTLRNSKKALLLIAELNMEKKVRLVLREDKKKTVLKEEVAQVLGCDVISMIGEDDKTATGAMNQARPVVIQAPETPLGKDLIRIAGMIYKGASETGSSKKPVWMRGFLSWKRNK